jgi:hypothetical protein
MTHSERIAVGCSSSFCWPPLCRTYLIRHSPPGKPHPTGVPLLGEIHPSNPCPWYVCLFFLSIRSIRRSSNERRQHQTRRPLNGNTRLEI